MNVHRCAPMCTVISTTISYFDPFRRNSHMTFRTNQDLAQRFYEFIHEVKETEILVDQQVVWHQQPLRDELTKQPPVPFVAELDIVEALFAAKGYLNREDLFSLSNNNESFF